MVVSTIYGIVNSTVLTNVSVSAYCVWIMKGQNSDSMMLCRGYAGFFAVCLSLLAMQRVALELMKADHTYMLLIYIFFIYIFIYRLDLYHMCQTAPKAKT